MGNASGKRRISNTGDKFLALFLLWRLRKEPMYGYLLIDEINGLGLSPRRQSTLYAILSKLEKAGLVKGKNKQVGRRMRKVYTTTAKGAGLLKRVKCTRMKGVLREFLVEMLG